MSAALDTNNRRRSGLRDKLFVTVIFVKLELIRTRRLVLENRCEYQCEYQLTRGRREQREVATRVFDA
jgi:hypothetical protein